MNSLSENKDVFAFDEYEKDWSGVIKARKRIEEIYLNGKTILDLSNLGLKNIPSEIGKLVNLTSLDLSGNLIHNFPAEICKLNSLTDLDLFDNLLTELPLEICQIITLTELNLSRNRITYLPPQIGQLKNLISLALSVNRLSSLPKEICELKALTTITLYDNVLKSLPKTLLELGNLTELFLEGNTALNVPDEVLGPKYREVFEKKVATNPPANIINYYFANLDRAEAYGTLPLNEAKLIVLGEAKVGKSSLILALTENRLKQPLQKTDGIVQKRWQIPLHAGQLVIDGIEENESLRVNLWDFGGQEIYKHTHTFFLTRRAVYLLVADARSNERQNNLEYWLQMAASFGDAPPIWIAINKCDEHGDGPDIFALKRKFPNLIRGFVRTSCWTGDGIQELRETLLKEVLALEGVRRPINKIWLAIKHALETMKTDIISTEDYHNLCKLHGEDEAEMAEKLLELWDSLGTVRYFPERDDDPLEIRDSAILNPEWVTNAVYAVLDDKKVRDSDGLAMDEDFHRILKKAGYPTERTRMIEHVMRRFDLLVDTPDFNPQHKMLIPQLLPEREPQHIWPSSGTLDFIYRYTVLPAGLLPSFIARCHKKLSKTPGPWRNGCILDFPTGARTRVIGDVDEKKVTISVTGDSSYIRDALDAVRSLFDDMHGTVKGLVVEELIPIQGRNDVSPISYRWLRSLELKGIQKIPIEGSKPGELIEIDVYQLLNNVRGKAREETERQTIIFYGENQKTTIHMGNTNKQEISGGTFNGPVGVNQAFNNSYNTTGALNQAELNQLLDQLNSAAIEAVSVIDVANREKLENRISSLTETSKKEKVDEEQLKFSAKGIIEAAGIFPPIVTATKAILSLFNIHLP